VTGKKKQKEQQVMFIKGFFNVGILIRYDSELIREKKVIAKLCLRKMMPPEIWWEKFYRYIVCLDRVESNLLPGQQRNVALHDQHLYINRMPGTLMDRLGSS
jgi:hypothetical protein